MTSPFSDYQNDFFLDTGLDWKTNVDTFIQYCQAKSLYVIMNQQLSLLNQLITKVGDLDN
jgi:hypothetical protein